MTDVDAERITVAHVITGLGTGGAEGMLLKLLTHLDQTRFASRVYSLLPVSGAIPDGIRALGIPVTSLAMPRGTPSPSALLRLRNLLGLHQPDIVQTWMYHADLVGGIAAKLVSPRLPVVWNIRHGTLDRGASRRRTVAVVRACAALSRWIPHTIVCVSEDARRIHAHLGYVGSKLVVIPNGFDTFAFRPDRKARAAIRAELQISDGVPAIGLIARFHPQKDHRSFVEAASRLHVARPDVHFIVCGTGASGENQELVAWIDNAGLRSVFHLLGERRDVPRVMAALDVATLSSSGGEGFPNVLGEAMACGIPCVATNVGDSARIIDDTGRTVPPCDPAALADAWRELIDLSEPEKRVLSERARKRVDERFSIQEIARAYGRLYDQIASTSSLRSTLMRSRLASA